MSFDPIQEHRLPHLLLILIPNSSIFSRHLYRFLQNSNYRGASRLFSSPTERCKWQEMHEKGCKYTWEGLALWTCRLEGSSPRSRRTKPPGRKTHVHVYIYIYTRAHLTARMPVAPSHPDEQQQGKQDQQDLQPPRLLGTPPERLLVDPAGTGGGAGGRWAVGAHVVEIPGELHLPGLLAEGLPDHRGLLGTARHCHVSAVMELIPGPGQRERAAPSLPFTNPC